MANNSKDETLTVEQQGNQVVHIRGDSDSELQALFEVVLKPSGTTPLVKPFKMRNLPKSFFVPPSHRQSPSPGTHSREGSSDSTFAPSGPGAPPGAGQHFRAHSSPATLQSQFGAQLSTPAQGHLKQHSYDLADDLGPLPLGWEQARTPQGQIYYLNHPTQTTTWEDPRKKLLQQNQQQSQPAGATGTATGATGTAAGQQTETGATAQQTPPPPPPPPAIPSTTPSQARRLQTPLSGTRSLAADSAAAAAQQQQQQQQQQSTLRLQQMQQEREQLRLRQREIMQTENLLRTSLREEPSGSSSSSNSSSSGDMSATSLTTTTTSSADPFMTTINFHSRQESSDSGVGGLGNTCSSHPHTPEDILQSMDDVEISGNDSEMSPANDILEGPELESMDSEDLVPSIQLNDELLASSNDFLNDVLNNPRINNLHTWL